MQHWKSGSKMTLGKKGRKENVLFFATAPRRRENIPGRQDTEGQRGNGAWQLCEGDFFFLFLNFLDYREARFHAPPPPIFMGMT